MSRLTLIVVALFLAGCQSGLSLFGDGEYQRSAVDVKFFKSQLDHLIERQDYQAALLFLEQVSEHSELYPQSVAYREKVNRQARQYSKQVVSQVQKYQQEQQWQVAETLLQGAMDKLPVDSLVHRRYQQFTQARKRFIDQQVLKLNLVLAERLLEEGEYREAIYRAKPASWPNSWSLKRYQRQRKEVAEFLAEQGDQALVNKRYDEAKKLLSLSKSLQPDQRVVTQLAKLNQQLDERWLKYLEKQAQQKEQLYLQLVADFQKFFKSHQYLLAQQQLEQLKSLRPEDPFNEQRASALATAINRQVVRAIERGQKSYTEGQVRDALDIWNSALILAPDHAELIQHITRAERFLLTYQKLSD